MCYAVRMLKTRNEIKFFFNITEENHTHMEGPYQNKVYRYEVEYFDLV
jgi:hypothetical protein